jgi:hypothetical protein
MKVTARHPAMKRPRNVLLALGWYDHRLLQGIATYASEHRWHLASHSIIHEKVIPWGWDGDGILAWLGAGDDTGRLRPQGRQADGRFLPAPTWDAFRPRGAGSRQDRRAGRGAFHRARDGALLLLQRHRELVAGGTRPGLHGNLEATRAALRTPPLDESRQESRRP